MSASLSCFTASRQISRSVPLQMTVANADPASLDSPIWLNRATVRLQIDVEVVGARQDAPPDRGRSCQTAPAAPRIEVRVVGARQTAPSHRWRSCQTAPSCTSRAWLKSSERVRLHGHIDGEVVGLRQAALPDRGLVIGRESPAPPRGKGVPVTLAKLRTPNVKCPLEGLSSRMPTRGTFVRRVHTRGTFRV